MKAYLEYKNTKSQKFWEIECKGYRHTVRYGKIGTPGQTRRTTLTSWNEAKADAEKQIAMKEKKGYKRVVGKKSSTTGAASSSKKKTTSKKATSAQSHKKEFWISKTPSGNESPEKLKTAFENLNWRHFDPSRDGETLRDLLLQHENKHGVSEAHLFASEKIRAHLTLLHPFGHDDAHEFHDVSPDGRWLATGSWDSTSWERGGVLQIWETAMARPVNYMRIAGGVAWPGNKGIEWSPDSQRLAMAFQTNAVGVWEPFSAMNEPVLYAEVTNGMDSSPYFHWSADGERIYIDYPYAPIGREFEYEEKYADRGCWVSALDKGDVEETATRGYSDGGYKRTLKVTPAFRKQLKLKKADGDVYPTASSGVVQVHQDTIRFYAARKGLIAKFHEVKPGFESPLHRNNEDPGNSMRVHPGFGITHRGRPEWGFAFEEGSVMLPSEFPAASCLNWSLGRQWVWPLDWAPFKRASTLDELVDDAQALPPDVRNHLKKYPAARDLDNAWPPALGKTHDDLVKLAVDCVTKGSINPEYITEIALTELVGGRAASALSILKKIAAAHRAPAFAELAWHALKRNQDAKPFLVEAERSLKKPRLAGDLKYRTSAHLATAHYLMGAKKKAQECIAQAKAWLDPEEEDDASDYINYFLMTGQWNALPAEAKATGYDQDDFVRDDTWHNLIRYTTLDEFLGFIRIMKNCVGDHDAAEQITRKLIHDEDIERLAKTAATNRPYRLRIVKDVLKQMAHAGKKIGPVLKKYLAAQPDGELQDLLQMAARENPDMARKIFLERKWGPAAMKDWWKGNDHDLLHAYQCGDIVGMLGLRREFAKQAEKLPGREPIAYGLATAAYLQPEAGEKEIRALLKKIPSNYGGKALLHRMAVTSAFHCHAPRYVDIIETAATFHAKQDPDLGLAELIRCLAELDDIPSTYACWMKITKASRRHRMDPLLALLCRKYDYDGLYALLMTLETNERSQKAVLVLQTLTGSRGYGLK